ncbi:MAG: tRNA pseudouridine(55) synthase TruB [Chloroflexota bacterium]|nr:MAG: tRNA pseudouridine(55) synthase TruB [Chloroflexota bacterium]
MARPNDRPAPDLDGIIIVDKPAGPTSHDVVALVRRLTGVRRVGHGGTLDPFAAGVLPVFLGRATRVVEYHLADDKGYRARVSFGARSTTDDLDGELTPSAGPLPGREAVEAVLGQFRGPLVQTPPDYSAVHIAGRRAYELARAGQKPELKARQVTIHALDLVDWDAAEGERPVATFEIRCSAGTYVRALARDLGEALGCGGYLVGLTRTASGPFTLAAAHPLEAVRAALAAGRARQVLLPPETGLDPLPEFPVTADELAALARGQVVRPHGPADGSASNRPDGSVVRVVGPDGRLAAIARLQAGRLHPQKVLLDLAAVPASAGGGRPGPG